MAKRKKYPFQAELDKSWKIAENSKSVIVTANDPDEEELVPKARHFVLNIQEANWKRHAKLLIESSGLMENYMLAEAAATKCVNRHFHTKTLTVKFSGPVLS